MPDRVRLLPAAWVAKSWLPVTRAEAPPASDRVPDVSVMASPEPATETVDPRSSVSASSDPFTATVEAASDASVLLDASSVMADLPAAVTWSPEPEISAPMPLSTVTSEPVPATRSPVPFVTSTFFDAVAPVTLSSTPSSEIVEVPRPASTLVFAPDT